MLDLVVRDAFVSVRIEESGGTFPAGPFLGQGKGTGFGWFCFVLFFPRERQLWFLLLQIITINIWGILGSMQV